MPQLIPLDLYGEITTASGTRYKIDANQSSGSRPLNFSFGTKIGEGFSQGSFQLPRRIDQDYPDLGLVNGVVFTGADGSTAYEGRIAAMPRDLSDRHSIGVTLAGYMASAKARRFLEIYVDRLTAHWGEMPYDEKVRLATTPVDFASFSFANDNGGLVCALPNQALGAQVAAEAWYEAPSGVTVGEIGYRGSTTTYGGGYETPGFAFETGTTLTGARTAATLDNTVRYITPTTATRRVMTLVYSNGSAATPAAGTNVRFDKLAAYGSSGIARRASPDTSEPDGVYASDVMRDIATRFVPSLDPSGIQATSYVIQQLAYLNPAFPYDAWLELNKYHLWNLAVWESRRLTFEPYDLTDYDWEIRTDDPGTTFSPQGPSTESLFNGMCVTYTNVLTGRQERITPDDDTTLADASTENPWNSWGEDQWDDIALSTPTLPDTAAQLGRAALEDRNRPRTPGTITVRGYIRDRAGNRQPCWKVRSGDTIAITNFPNDTPRLIVETTYDNEAKSVSLAIDKPFALLDAYLDRVSNALQGAGLA